MVDIPGSTIAFAVLSVVLPLGLWVISTAAGGSPSALVIGAATLTLIGLTALDYRFSKHRGEMEEALKSQPLVRPIFMDAFHEEFQQAIKRADHRADICFFDNESPLESHREPKKTYYERQQKMVQGNPDVRFRRLIRGLPSTQDWIERMVQEMEGSPNFSLACILDEEPKTRSLPHISVQLVDQHETFFVAVGQQTEGWHPRDLYIRSEDVNTQWTTYYDHLWEDRAITVLENGKIREEGLETVREHIENLE